MRGSGYKRFVGRVPSGVASGRLLVGVGALAAGCLVGTYEVNPALDGDAGSGASQPGGGNTSKGGSSGGTAEGGSDSSGGDATPGGGSVTGGSATQGGTFTDGGSEGGLGGEGGGSVVGNCGYDEQNDASNQRATPSLTGTAEDTGQSTSGQVDICGRIDADHFVAGTQVVDIDSYSIEVAGAGEVYATIEFAKEVPADSVQLVVALADADQRPVLAAASNGALWSAVPAGELTVSVVVRNASALTQAIPYRIRVVSDDFDARCPRLADPDPNQEQTEASDGPLHQGNDTVRVSDTSGSVTGVAASAPEDLGLILQGDVYVVHGSAASSSIEPAYAYEDGDGYILTPFGTGQLSLRVDWTGNGADLDLWVFDADTREVVARSARPGSATGPERLTFAVTSGTDYLVWVGAAQTSTSLPASYDVTICGEAFGQ